MFIFARVRVRASKRVRWERGGLRSVKTGLVAVAVGAGALVPGALASAGEERPLSHWRGTGPGPVTVTVLDSLPDQWRSEELARKVVNHYDRKVHGLKLRIVTAKNGRRARRRCVVPRAAIRLCAFNRGPEVDYGRSLMRYGEGHITGRRRRGQHPLHHHSRTQAGHPVSVRACHRPDSLGALRLVHEPRAPTHTQRQGHRRASGPVRLAPSLTRRIRPPSAPR
ncbi:MAG: hypothetical protein H0V60_00965 [Actinobacteria bacterium]|nr:hypothetical protein [Actinomycetota bacterium]